MKALTSASPQPDLDALAGGKARNLSLLGDCGLCVPDWAVIGTDTFRHVLALNGMRRDLELLAASPPADAEEIATELRRRITSGPVDPVAHDVIRQAYAAAGGGLVAVRSSGTEEDSERFSFAGQFATFLNVRGLSNVIEQVQACWASAFGEDAVRYRLQHGLSLADVAMAVIVQRMVPADRSGVLFTIDPVSGSRAEFIISAVYGLGEGLVSGAVDADTIVVDRATGMTRTQTIGAKSERFDAAEGAEGPGGCRVSSVPMADRAALALSAEDIGDLVAAGARIEAALGAPQDVEWALVGRRLYVLQSRPVTTVPPASPALDDDLLIWDNSNIIESFGGITAPLTFTFAQHVYHRAHQEYCRMLHVPLRQLREMDDWQRNRLGYFHGHVYYNLLAWYRMQRLLPLAAMKRRVMELSMGIDVPVPQDLIERLQPFEPSGRAVDLATRARAAGVFWWHFAATGRYVRRFLDGFNRTFAEFERVDYNRLPGDQVYARFMRLDRELLPRWAPMIGLEVVILTSYGMLLGLTRRWLPDAPPWLAWKVANPGGGVESAEQPRLLADLAREVRSDPALERIVEASPVECVRDRIAEAGYRDLSRRIEDYLDRFGYRGLNELKLEVPDLRDDPAAFGYLLRAAVADSRPTDVGPDAADPEDSGALGARPSAGTQDVDGYLAEHLSVARRLAYNVLRAKVQRSLAARERVRLCRTRAFGLARRMFLAMGRDLARLGAIESPDDVWYLRLDEVRGCFEGTIGHGDLRPVVEMRKREQAADAELTAPERFVTRGPVYWRGNAERAGWTRRSSMERPGELRGTPCSPGIAEGIATVISEPCDVRGGVLVAYRTDPGWAAMLPSAAALLIERGSPLTHVAIVARELGIPAVVQIKNLTDLVETGMRLRVDGGSGRVDVIRTTS